jgi:hypothetical protein
MDRPPGPPAILVQADAHSRMWADRAMQRDRPEAWARYVFGLARLFRGRLFDETPTTDFVRAGSLEE